MRYAALLCAAGLLTAADISFSKREIAMGKVLAEEVKREYTLSRDAEARERLARLGERLAQAAGMPPMTFELLGASDPVAGGLPGGYIYISAGAAARAETEAELAALLAHQVAHIAARHSLKGQPGRLPARPPEAPLVIIHQGGWLGACPLSGFYVPLGLQPQRQQFEQEADALAADYLRAAGFDPEAAVDIVAKIASRPLKAAIPGDEALPPPSLRRPARGGRR